MISIHKSGVFFLLIPATKCLACISRLFLGLIVIPSQLCERIPGRSGHKIQILSFYPTVDVLSPQLHRGTLHEHSFCPV